MKLTDLNKDIKRMKELAHKCPMDDEDPDCPFIDMRCMPLRVRMQIIDNMDSTEIKRIACFHVACLRNKETEKLRQN